MSNIFVFPEKKRLYNFNINTDIKFFERGFYYE